jgi:hypothetical protein
MVVIELDVFSGRPNPRWELDEPSARRLVEIHRQLDASVRASAEPPGLGYRGFRYILDDVAWRAWNATVLGGGRSLADPDRSVERLLLDRLPTEYDELRARLATEIEPKG